MNDRNSRSAAAPADLLVSVVIPLYNSAKFIGATLDSVLGQTWNSIEVIVVDDGSTDDSPNIVEQRADSRIRLIEQAHSGAAAARNKALACASGDYIQYLDSDDLISPEKIELQLARIRDRSDAIATCAWGRFFADPSHTRYLPDTTWEDLSPKSWIAENWRLGNPMHCVHSFLLPRHICEAAGGWNSALLQNEDGEYFTRILSLASEVVHCKGAYAMYRSGLPSSLSRQIGGAQFESRFLALHLCEQRILTLEDTDRMRRGLALAWQNLAHSCHPYDAELAEHALARARALHSVQALPSAGVVFNAVTALLGWRAARRLQVLSGQP